MADFMQVNSSGLEVWKSGVVSNTYTPAATSHTALDCVGGAKTFVIPGAANRMVKITGYRFNMDTTTPVTTIWTAYMYNATPAVIADDANYTVVSADNAKFQGTIAIIQCVDFASTLLEAQGYFAAPQVIQMGATDTLTIYLQNVSTVTLEAVAHKLILFYEIQP